MFLIIKRDCNKIRFTHIGDDDGGIDCLIGATSMLSITHRHCDYNNSTSPDTYNLPLREMKNKDFVVLDLSKWEDLTIDYDKKVKE